MNHSARNFRPTIRAIKTARRWHAGEPQTSLISQVGPQFLWVLTCRVVSHNYGPEKLVPGCS